MPSERDKAEYDRIIALLADRLGVSREQVADRLPGLDDIVAIDSLDVEELALELEKEFGDDLKRP